MTKGILLIFLCCGIAFASKPSVSWKRVIEKSNFVVVGKALNSCSYCSKDNPASFQVVEAQKGGIETKVKITVSAPYLSFEKDKNYILFLKNKEEWIEGSSPRPLASKSNLERLRLILQKK